MTENLQQIKELSQALQYLQVQNWIMTGVVALVGTVLWYMIRESWKEQKRFNHETDQRIKLLENSNAVLNERHETGQAIRGAGEDIAAAIQANSEAMVQTLRAITPPQPPRR